jgi:hypothetical protein
MSTPRHGVALLTTTKPTSSPVILEVASASSIQATGPTDLERRAHRHEYRLVDLAALLGQQRAAGVPSASTVASSSNGAESDVVDTTSPSGLSPRTAPTRDAWLPTQTAA